MSHGLRPDDNPLPIPGLPEPEPDLFSELGDHADSQSDHEQTVDAAVPEDPDGEDPDAAVEEEGDLGDLDGLGNELFNIWWDGSEARWAAYMWSILEKAGLTAYEDWDEAGRTLVVCRLIALAGINREFAARAWGEGFSGEWQESVELASLLGEYPLLDEVAVGRLAERTGAMADADRYGNRESAMSLLCEIASGEWRTVVKALTDDLGESWLFASLWMTRDGDARYPLPNEIIGDIVNAPTTEMMDPFAWVSDGCNWRA
ncbi:MAG: hypothetical protein ACRDS9_29050 [Pseudonocardiaceae bacterium]